MEFYLGPENISRGTIKKMICQNCDITFDCFSIIGDSEAMNFLGVIGITNLKAKEIFITHLTKEEFQNYKSIPKEEVVNRIGKLLNRDNLAYFRKNVDFNGKLYTPCQNCNSQTKEISEISLTEYVESGGKIYSIANYPNN